MKKFLFIFILVTAMLMTLNTWAFRKPDMTGDDNGAAVIYQFSEEGGTSVADTSGAGSPLNLVSSIAGNFPPQNGTTIKTNLVLTNGVLYMNPKPNATGEDADDNEDSGYQSAQLHRTFLISNQADKLNSCSGGITVQAFVRPWFPFQGSQSSMIVGLTNSTETSLNAPNFAVYQTGMSGSEALKVAARNASGNAVETSTQGGVFLSVREAEMPGFFTEIIASLEADGTLTAYVGNPLTNSRIMSASTKVSAAFLPTAKLIIGNELVSLTNMEGTQNPDVSKQRNWSGEIKHMAIYCRGYSKYDILGEAIPGQVKAPVIKPGTGVITEARKVAQKMYNRLTGVVTPIDNPDLIEMETLINQGKRLEAARLVTGDAALNIPVKPEFLNTVVKQFALKMSTREETIRLKLNDFAASFIGVTRDETDARELLYGDFFYMANPEKASVRSGLFNDLLRSNNHYEDLDDGKWDIQRALMRVNGQKLAVSESGTTTDHPDPAGVLTSRAFLGAHAVAGTNRRIIEYTLREFLCVPISEAADTAASPARIGRDIDRKPGADGSKFETSCKGCHTVMDGFRGAFSKFDYDADNMIVKHTELSYSGMYSFGNNANCNNNTANAKDTNNTICKMNHNNSIFPDGYKITDSSFVNYAINTKNKNLFGWRGAYARGGQGAGQFGRMVADSKRFSECMAKRVYEQVCLPGEGYDYNSVKEQLQGYASKFEAEGYKLKTLFREVVANPNCLK